MTAYTTEQNSLDFMSKRVGEYLAGPDGIEFVNGLISLCGVLLTGLAKAEGASGNATPEEQRAILQRLALMTYRQQ
jgi:hypothetical protein